MALLVLGLFPLGAMGQSTEKVLVMNVKRVSGNPLTAQLRDTEGFTGPLWNLLTGRLTIGANSVARSRIKEIRFEVQEVDGVSAPEVDCTEDGNDNTPIYDLQGRRIQKKDMRKGIYIIKGKKYIKR